MTEIMNHDPANPNVPTRTFGRNVTDDAIRENEDGELDGYLKDLATRAAEEHMKKHGQIPRWACSNNRGSNPVSDENDESPSIGPLQSEEEDDSLVLVQEYRLSPTDIGNMDRSGARSPRKNGVLRSSIGKHTTNHLTYGKETLSQGFTATPKFNAVSASRPATPRILRQRVPVTIDPNVRAKPNSQEDRTLTWTNSMVSGLTTADTITRGGERMSKPPGHDLCSYAAKSMALPQSTMGDSPAEWRDKTKGRNTPVDSRAFCFQNGKDHMGFMKQCTSPHMKAGEEGGLDARSVLQELAGWDKALSLCWTKGGSGLMCAHFGGGGKPDVAMGADDEISLDENTIISAGSNLDDILGLIRGNNNSNRYHTRQTSRTAGEVITSSQQHRHGNSRSAIRELMASPATVHYSEYSTRISVVQGNPSGKDTPLTSNGRGNRIPGGGDSIATESSTRYIDSSSPVGGPEDVVFRSAPGTPMFSSPPAATVQRSVGLPARGTPSPRLAPSPREGSSPRGAPSPWGNPSRTPSPRGTPSPKATPPPPPPPPPPPSHSSSSTKLGNGAIGDSGRDGSDHNPSRGPAQESKSLSLSLRAQHFAKNARRLRRRKLLNGQGGESVGESADSDKGAAAAVAAGIDLHGEQRSSGTRSTTSHDSSDSGKSSRNDRSEPHPSVSDGHVVHDWDPFDEFEFRDGPDADGGRSGESSSSSDGLVQSDPEILTAATDPFGPNQDDWEQFDDSPFVKTDCFASRRNRGMNNRNNNNSGGGSTNGTKRRSSDLGSKPKGRFRHTMQQWGSCGGGNATSVVLEEKKKKDRKSGSTLWL